MEEVQDDLKVSAKIISTECRRAVTKPRSALSPALIVLRILSAALCFALGAASQWTVCSP